MKKRLLRMAALLPALFLLSGCGAIGSKSTSLSVIYAATAVLSLLLLLSYCLTVRKRDKWFVLLFSSVVVVNTGYLALALSKTIEMALWANRLSYLGSVFLPLAMLMILLNTTGLQYRRCLPIGLTILSVVVFLVAASPGYLDVYYKTVALSTAGGVTVLQKEYGPLHDLYLVYLMLYFAVMIAVIIHAAAKKKLESRGHAAILVFAVGCNIGVWLLEQLVRIDFEFLSVSYIISVLFLLGVNLMLDENKPCLTAAVAASEPEKESAAVLAEEEAPISPTIEERRERFAANLPHLTQTERLVYDFYIEGKTTKEIMAALNIKENTLKYHNKNIYSKLGVSSRKQLIELAGMLQSATD